MKIYLVFESVKYEGDTFMAAFKNELDAINYAVKLNSDAKAEYMVRYYVEPVDVIMQHLQPTPNGVGLFFCLVIYTKGMLMENKEKELEEWLEACPLPVIGRVIDNEDAIRHVAMSHFIYEEDMLIAIPLSTLASLLKY